jgi:transcriptional regulator with XRE-family HTH domain
MMHESLARRLRVLRAERGWTLQQAADRAGVQPETISDAEHGKRRPYTPTLAKIAKGYGVPVEKLLEESAPKEVAPSLPSQREEEERRELLHPVVRELEDLRQFVLDERLEDWETILRGEAFLFNLDHGYVIDQIGLATGLRDFLKTLRRRAEDELPADSAILALVLRDVEDLRERINNLMSELQAGADAAAGITDETPEQERLDRMATRSKALQLTRLSPDVSLDQLSKVPEEEVPDEFRWEESVGDDESSSAGGTRAS